MLDQDGGNHAIAAGVTKPPDEAEALIGGCSNITCDCGPLGGESEDGSLDTKTRISHGGVVVLLGQLTP